MSLVKIKEPQSSTYCAKPDYNDDRRTFHNIFRDKLTGLTGLNPMELMALMWYNCCEGLEQYGQVATDAVYKEMKQLYDCKTICLCFVMDLSQENKQKALMHIIIKEKQYGMIKGAMLH